MSHKLGSIQTSEGKKGKTYRAQIRVKGYPHQSKTFKLKREAEEWLRENITAMKKGLPFETKPMRVTYLSDIIDRYITDELDPKSTNYQTRTGQLNWWKDEIGSLLLTHVKEDVIARCRKKLQNTQDRYGHPRGNATVNRYMTSIPCVLGKACKGWLCMEDSYDVSGLIQDFSD